MHYKPLARVLSSVLCALVLCVNLHAITAKAAPVDSSSAYKIANAINLSTQGYINSTSRSNYYSSLVSGKIVFINSFQITDLDAPHHGQLLDSTAIVIADNGTSWEIPVLWVNQNGELIKIAIDGVTTCYPIFVFFMPEGYSLMFGENYAYNMKMPDFVCNLFTLNGVATMSNPQRGITYITPLLPNQSGFRAVTPAGYYDSDISSQDGGSAPIEGSETIPSDSENNGSNHDSTPKDQYQYRDYKDTHSDDEKQQIAQSHGDPNIIDKLGVDNVSWFVSFIKDVIEPEAVNLLLSSFPAYKEAANNDELGKNLGFYVYFNDSYDTNGSIKDESGYIGYVTWKNPSNAVNSYRMGINANYMYAFQTDSNSYEFDGDDAYITLDRTVVHELMHGLMVDYTKTGMTGAQYIESEDAYTYQNSNDLVFPNWFFEGLPTTLESPYQKWYYTFHSDYGYDQGTYSAKALKDSYVNDEKMQLAYTANFVWGSNKDNSRSSYVSGCLASEYLGYLAALKYNDQDAITTRNDGSYTVSSAIIRGGVNSLLKKLHEGKTLDEIINEISLIDGVQLYTDSDNFTNEFIALADGSDGDNGKSLDFCTKLLNYLESASTDDKIANGSILLDFTDTSELLLTRSLLNNKPEVYVLTDSSDYADSTVDVNNALTSGGKSDIGIISIPGSGTNYAPGSASATMAGSDALTNSDVDENIDYKTDDPSYEMINPAISNEPSIESISDAITVAMEDCESFKSSPDNKNNESTAHVSIDTLDTATSTSDYNDTNTNNSTDNDIAKSQVDNTYPTESTTTTNNDSNEEYSNDSSISESTIASSGPLQSITDAIDAAITECKNEPQEQKPATDNCQIINPEEENKTENNEDVSILDAGDDTLSTSTSENVIPNEISSNEDKNPSNYDNTASESISLLEATTKEKTPGAEEVSETSSIGESNEIDPTLDPEEFETMEESTIPEATTTPDATLEVMTLTDVTDTEEDIPQGILISEDANNNSQSESNENDTSQQVLDALPQENPNTDDHSTVEESKE